VIGAQALGLTEDSPQTEPQGKNSPKHKGKVFQKKSLENTLGKRAETGRPRPTRRKTEGTKFNRKEIE